MAKVKSRAREGRINARLNAKEFQEVLTKAIMYNDGNLSAFTRDAVLKYKPISKREIK